MQNIEDRMGKCSPLCWALEMPKLNQEHHPSFYPPTITKYLKIYDYSTRCFGDFTHKSTPAVHLPHCHGTPFTTKGNHPLKLILKKNFNKKSPCSAWPFLPHCYQLKVLKQIMDLVFGKKRWSCLRALLSSSLFGTEFLWFPGGLVRSGMMVERARYEPVYGHNDGSPKAQH